VLAATGVALAAWAVAGPLAGINLDVRQGGAVERVEPASVVAAALLAGLVGWALLAATERLLSGPRVAWLSSALVALGLSLVGPLVGAVDPAGKAALAGMHLIVGAVLVYGLVGSQPAPKSTGTPRATCG
jgi:hypothetical protein